MKDDGRHASVWINGEKSLVVSPLLFLVVYRQAVACRSVAVFMTS